MIAPSLPSGQRRFSRFLEAVDPDDLQIARLDGAQAVHVATDEFPLDIARFDRGNDPALRLDVVDFPSRTRDQFPDLGGDDRRAIENVLVLEQIGFEGHHLLHPQCPLLIPGARQAHRLVPGGELDGAGSRAFREHDRQHLQHDSLHVVFRLRLGQPQGVYLHAIAEPPQPGIFNLVAGQRQFVPHFSERPELAALFDETYAGIDKEGDTFDDLGKRLRLDLAGSLHPIKHRHRRAQGISQFLHRRGPRLLQVVTADIGRIPLRHMLDRVVDRIRDQAHRGTWRIDVGAAREILLDDIVLGGTAQFLRVDPPALRQADVQRQ
jgi:hypothetical protein